MLRFLTCMGIGGMWPNDPDGNAWEFYTVLADTAERATGDALDCCADVVTTAPAATAVEDEACCAPSCCAPAPG